MVGALILACLGAGLTIGANLVRSRMREIGLLKAVGFSNGRVARLFGMELAIFALVDSMIGVLLGLAAMIAIESSMRGTSLLGVQMANGLAAPSAIKIVALIGFPVVALLLGGVLPLVRAATLPPDVALREMA
jgi:putative ABC transport system permease protein